jgi:hypothetical protein
MARAALRAIAGATDRHRRSARHTHRPWLGFDFKTVKGGRVPIFMVERNYAEELEPNIDAADGINRINAEEGVRWLYSFLSADKRKTYCLYEAPSPEAIRTAAARAGLPADVVVEVTDRITPDGRLTNI